MRGLLYIIAILMLTACSASGTRVKRSLDEAGALMHTDPTAAMERLNGLDLTEFDDSADMARWALLYSEALVANQLTAPTDTIVDIAVRYYGRDGGEEYRHACALKAMLKSSGSADPLATALYLEKEKEFMLYRERVRRGWIVAGAVALLLLAGGVIVWQRERLRLHEARHAALLAEASGLREDLDRNHAESSAMRDKLASLLAGRFDTIDELCQTYYESQGTRTERKAVAEKVKAQIEALKSDDGLFGDMERCVNDGMDGLLDTLRTEWPTIRPEDYRLMVYLAARLSNRTIALLIGESMEVTYKRKSRLKARISALDLPGRERFMAIF
ncbi:MAG: hypothetical protein K2H87_01405 [Duncaniella sp.]|nr:hypothetical protein [Duncaniella sp.]